MTLMVLRVYSFTDVLMGSKYSFYQYKNHKLWQVLHTGLLRELLMVSSITKDKGKRT